MNEIEKEPIIELCIYCRDYQDVPAVEMITTIDERREPVCNLHSTWANASGLVKGGTEEPWYKELADYIRDVIQDNTRRRYEMRSVKDIENGL